MFLLMEIMLFLACGYAVRVLVFYCRKFCCSFSRKLVFLLLENAGIFTRSNPVVLLADKLVFLMAEFSKYCCRC